MEKILAIDGGPKAVTEPNGDWWWKVGIWKSGSSTG